MDVARLYPECDEISRARKYLSCNAESQVAKYWFMLRVSDLRLAFVKFCSFEDDLLFDVLHSAAGTLLELLYLVCFVLVASALRKFVFFLK